MRIALASSGLGHVARGIETWAMDTAAALAERGVDVTLFAGAFDDSMIRSFDRSDKAAGPATTSPDESRNQRLPAVASAKEGSNGLTNQQIIALPCLRRFEPRTLRLVRMMPGWTWRWGLKAGYGWEQFSFWCRLWPKLRKGGYDILHVQDPMLAFWCRKFRKLGLVKTKEVLAHGTEEPAEWLAQFEYVQHLAPYHLANAECSTWSEGGGKKKTTGPESSSRHPHWVAIPNFVDTELFQPAKDAAEKAKCRKKLGIPVDAFAIGTAATVKKPHKRIDYLIREFSLLAAHDQNRLANKSSCQQTADDQHRPALIIAGARTPQSPELVALANDLAPGRITFRFDLPREQMPDFYRALDLFVLASVFEMMPIAVLEALASGVAAVCNDTPVLRWMVGAEGAGGACIDMAQDEGLAGFLGETTPEWCAQKGAAARKHALQAFSTDAVIGQDIEYYQRVLGS